MQHEDSKKGNLVEDKGKERFEMQQGMFKKGQIFGFWGDICVSPYRE